MFDSVVCVFYCVCVFTECVFHFYVRECASISLRVLNLPLNFFGLFVSECEAVRVNLHPHASVHARLYSLFE